MRFLAVLLVIAMVTGTMADRFGRKKRSTTACASSNNVPAGEGVKCKCNDDPASEVEWNVKQWLSNVSYQVSDPCSPLKVVKCADVPNDCNWTPPPVWGK